MNIGNDPVELVSPTTQHLPTSMPQLVTQAQAVTTDGDIEVPIKIAKVTAYSCGGLETDEEIRMNCPSLLSGKPQTATGTEPIPYQTAACDKANLGRVFEIEGVGQVKCTDTGGAIKGAGRFDLYVADVQEAREWGVKNLEYKLIAPKD